MFVLDTNVISELRKAGDGRADPSVVAWLAGQDAATLFLSAITVMELEIGTRRVERRDRCVAFALELGSVGERKQDCQIRRVDRGCLDANENVVIVQ